MVREIMKEPALFVTEIMKTTNYRRNLRKCMDILRDYHFYFSVESNPDKNNDPNYNVFSKKLLPLNLHRVQTFDKINFQTVYDEIRFFLTCSSTKHWYVAVFHRRVL